MTDIKKYVEGKSQKELLDIQRNSVVDGEVYKAVTFEIQRVQQDTNNKQIADLIGEVKKLKDITDSNAKDSVQNAKSSNRLAKIAIWIAIISVAIQAIVGMVSSTNCADYGNGEGQCFTWISLGPWTWLVSDPIITAN